MKTCFENSTEVSSDGAFCGYELRKYCSAEEKKGKAACEACATAHASKLSRACTQKEIDDACSGKSPPSPSPWPPHHRSNCDYDQVSPWFATPAFSLSVLTDFFFSGRRKLGRCGTSA